MNGPSQSMHVGACCCQGVSCRRIQGNMFEQFGVDGKLYVEVRMT